MAIELVNWLEPLAANISDPRVVLPDAIDLAVGKRLQIWKSNVPLLDGRPPAISATSNLARGVFEAEEDRIILMGDAGDVGQSRSLTMACGLSSDTCAINVVQPYTSAFSATFFGDSITFASGDGGFCRWFYLAFPLCTPKGTQISGTCKTEGYPGKTYAWLNGQGDQSTPSPLNDAAAWATSVSGRPDIAFLLMSTNDIFTAQLGTIDTTIAASLANAEGCIAKLQAIGVPKIIVGSCFPGHRNYDAVWTPGFHTDWWTWQQKQHRFRQLAKAQFMGRRASGIFYLDTGLFTDPSGGYDPVQQIHPNTTYGDLTQSEAMVCTAHVALAA